MKKGLGHFRVFAISIVIALLNACGGGDSGSGSDKLSGEVVDSSPSIVSSESSSSGSFSPSDAVNIRGKITYDRVPFVSSYQVALDYDNIIAAPARSVLVSAIDSDGSIVAITATSETGEYSLNVPKNTEVSMRVYAKIESSLPTWSVTVRDNTNSSATYVIDGSLVSSGDSNMQTRDIHAESGWGGDSYTRVRAAAPFAILDSIYDSIKTLESVDPVLALPPLMVYWSVDNIAMGGSYSEGFIGSSIYVPSTSSIYILGSADNDTDEYDRAVVQHEFGHFVEDQLSRGDSIGGIHSLDGRLDPRVAYSEAWGNAFSAISSGDSVYKDSLGSSQSFGFGFDIESNAAMTPGWFNERSVQSIIYDLVDSNNDGVDQVSLGFGAIYEAMRSSEYLTFEGVISIFNLVDSIKQDQPQFASDIDYLLNGHNIFGEDAYGSNELNDAGSEVTLPLYHQLTHGGTVNVCSDADYFEYNGVDVNRFILIDVPQDGDYSFNVVRSGGSKSTTNPQVKMYSRGTFIGASTSSASNREAFTINLSAGPHMIEVYEQTNVDNSTMTGGHACFDVSFN